MHAAARTIKGLHVAHEPAHTGVQTYNKGDRRVRSNLAVLVVVAAFDRGFATVLVLWWRSRSSAPIPWHALGQKVQTIVQINNAKTELANDLLSAMDSLAGADPLSRLVCQSMETDIDGKKAEAESIWPKAAQKVHGNGKETGRTGVGSHGRRTPNAPCWPT